MKHQIYTIHDDEKNIYYHAKTICDILELRNARHAVRELKNRKKYNQLKNNDNNKKRFGARSNWIDHESLRYLLAKSRRVDEDLLNLVGIELYSMKIECVEASIINGLRKSLPLENIIQNHCILQYNVDLYFPDYKLIIEIDENNHKHYDKDKEEQRENDIKNHIKDITLLRYNPDGENFNIFDMIGDITKIITNLKK